MALSKLVPGICGALSNDLSGKPSSAIGGGDGGGDGGGEGGWTASQLLLPSRKPEFTVLLAHSGRVPQQLQVLHLHLMLGVKLGVYTSQKPDLEVPDPILAHTRRPAAL